MLSDIIIANFRRAKFWLIAPFEMRLPDWHKTGRMQFNQSLEKEI